MNNYILQTESAKFRPVKIEDAEFIVKLRNLPHARRVIHGTSSDVEQQEEWIRQYLERDNEYYWIKESLDGKPLGTTSLYNYNKKLNQIEAGRWVNIPNSGSASLSGHVIFRDFAYKILGVNRVVCDTAVTNIQVIKYHQFLGERIFDRIIDNSIINGQKQELIWFEETAEMWIENRKKLLKFCGVDEDRKIFRINADGQLEEINYLLIN